MLYYFLKTSFPDLQLDKSPELSFAELHEVLVENLSEKHFALYREFLFYIDLQNLRSFIVQAPIDPRGFFSKQELQEALLFREGFPEYVFVFLDRFEETKDRLAHFTQLYISFYQKKKEGFLGAYFSHLRQMRWVLAALRAKSKGKNLLPELQFEEEEDRLIAYIIAQKDAAQFEPPPEFSRLKEVFCQHETDPLLLEKALLAYQIDAIEELEEGKPFEIDQVLAFAIKLFLIESWHLLDKERGKEALKRIV